MGEKGKWHIARSRYVPTIWPIWAFWTFPFKPVFGIDKGTALKVWDRGAVYIIWELDAWNRLGHLTVADLRTHVNDLDSLRLRGIEAGMSLVAHTREFAARVSSASHADCLQYFSEMADHYGELIRTNMAYWLFSPDVLQQEIAQALSEYSKADATVITTTMSVPNKPSYSRVEEQEFEELVTMARKNGMDDPMLQNAVEAFTKKYYWFPYEYAGPVVWDVDAVNARIRDSLSSSSASHGRIIGVEEQQACVLKYDLSQEIQNLFFMLQITSLMQDDRKMFNAQVCAELDNVILRELANRYAIPFEWIRYMDIEMMERMPSLTEADRETLRKRLDFLVIIDTEDTSRFVEGKEGRAEVHALGVDLGSGDDEVKELRGMTAQGGKIRGHVRVLRLAGEGSSFKEGEVLVTGMTTPDYVVLMKKASAIITDEGGITCHAAIVSRELGKPCIIGTKIATKALKDGDEVEVDADKGIVRIIKRH